MSANPARGTLPDMFPVSVEPINSDAPAAADNANPLPAAVAPTAPPQIAYEPGLAAPVNRRQFRFLLTLTLINTLILGGFVAGPGISRMTSGWWQGYQRWRADRQTAQQRAVAQQKSAQQRAAALQKFSADFQACLGNVASPTQVVYEEDPTRAAALLKRGTGYAAISSSSSRSVFIPPAPWQVPVLLKNAGTATQLRSTSDSTVAFLHGRKTPDGAQRLVWVDFKASEQMLIDSEAPATTRYYNLRNDRIFTARAYDPAADGTLHVENSRSLLILQPLDRQTLVVWHKGDSWESGRIEPHLSNVMRIFSGQPDPKDESHFTISYELDGNPGVIDGWLLRDQTVALQPRTGGITSQDNQGRSRVWNPYADPPTTRPADPNLLVPVIPQRPR